MTRLFRSALVLLALCAGTAALPEAAHAYGGPGSVVSGIGALLAAIAAIAAAIFGFLWFPLKRLIRKFRGPDDGQLAEAETEAREGVARE